MIFFEGILSKKRAEEAERIEVLQNRKGNEWKTRVQQAFCTALQMAHQNECYYSSFSTLLAPNSNDIITQKQCYEKKGRMRRKKKSCFMANIRQDFCIFSSGLLG
jgi:hypothetical protein